jgi:S1-C subfamily serine protease
LIKGITAEPLSEELRKSKNIPDDVTGLFLTEVSPKSPYADLLQSGMVLLEVNDRTIKSLDEARKALSPGKLNKLYVWRDGRSSFLVVKIS